MGFLFEKREENQGREITESRVEDYSEIMKRLMGEIAEKTNAELGEGFLNSDASINMRQWTTKEGGTYKKEDVKIDEKNVYGKKLMYSGAERHQQGEQEKIVSDWEARREKSKPALLEAAATAIFHKALGDNYFVMRSSVYDDYENGVDNVIVNKKTGQVICAFDEVRENTIDSRKIRELEEEKSRKEKKEEKIIKKAKAGGSKIKYGFTFENSGGERKLVKKEITNIPIFYVALNEAELDELLEKMGEDADTPINETEERFFKKFISSFEKQIAVLEKENLPPPIARNIDSFKDSLGEMKRLMG